MFRVQTLYKNTNNVWIGKTDSLRTDDIQTICDLFELLNKKEIVEVTEFGVNEDLRLWIRKDEISLFRNYDTIFGHKKTVDIKNLYDFLSVLYAEQNIGGLSYLHVLFRKGD